MIGALKSIEPIGFLSFAPASAETNRADVDRRIIQNCPYGRGAAACAGRPVWFRLRRLRIKPPCRVARTSRDVRLSFVKLAAIGRVGKPDAAIGVRNDVIGRIEALAVERVGD